MAKNRHWISGAVAIGAFTAWFLAQQVAIAAWRSLGAWASIGPTLAILAGGTLAAGLAKRFIPGVRSFSTIGLVGGCFLGFFFGLTLAFKVWGRMAWAVPGPVMVGAAAQLFVTAALTAYAFSAATPKRNRASAARQSTSSVACGGSLTGRTD